MEIINSSPLYFSHRSLSSVSSSNPLGDMRRRRNSTAGFIYRTAENKMMTLYWIFWLVILYILYRLVTPPPPPGHESKKKKKNKKNIEKNTAYNILRGRRFHEPKTWRRASVLPHHQTTGPKNIRVAAEIVCYRIVSSTEERKKSISQHKRDGWKI